MEAIVVSIENVQNAGLSAFVLQSHLYLHTRKCLDTITPLYSLLTSKFRIWSVHTLTGPAQKSKLEI